MHLFTGSPLALKKQFLDTLEQLKQNPLERVLVVIPSKHLEARLKTELCQKLSCLAGVSFMPLGALASEINSAAANPPLPLAEDTPLIDFKIKNLLNKNGFRANRSLAICFKNSFRDLINAEVTPEALSLVQEDEDLILDEQKTYLKQFIPLYKEFLEIQKEPGKNTYKDYFISARQNAASNTFLNSFKSIIFYGFYDLTSLHFELVKAVINSYTDITQVYLPYEETLAYTFVEPVYNTLFLPLCKQHTKLESENNLIKTAAENIFTPNQRSTHGADIEIIKVSGEGEVQAAAKEILKLHKDGLAYKDIAVTFRGEGGFNAKILDVFRQNQIPVNYNFSFPLIQKPFAAFVYNLFNLDSGNFAREEVLSVVNSPFFAFRQDAWADLIQQSGVECSITQFEEMLDNNSTEQKQTLIDVLKEIKAHLNLLKQAGSFESLAQKAKDLLLKYTYENTQTEQAETLKKITDILETISTYSKTGECAKDGEFLEEFFSLLKEANFNKVSSAPNAVEAADIMNLRLQDFKAIIILGLNEGVFPLVPQQDPALKEVYRQSLRKPLRRALQNIGYLIHTTQNRYFEENFLFYLALSAAQQKAILTYKTSDLDGKTLVKSAFVTMLLNVLGKTEEDLKSFSRRPLERLKNDIEQELLTKEETAALLALIKPDAREILGNLLAGEKEKPLFEKSYFDLRALSSQNSLTDFDGIINERDAQKIYPSYFSPSALSTLFACPAKYLFYRIAGKEKDIFLRSEIASNKKGTLYHEILKDFYTFIKTKKDFLYISWPDMENSFNNFLDTRFSKSTTEKYGLYPLLWEIIKQEIKENLLQFLKEDLERIQKTGFVPNDFECPVKNTLNIENKPLVLQAIADRVDKSADGKESIVIDYKSKDKGITMEKLIFEKNTLQPPIYLEILNKDNSNCFCSEADLAFIERKIKTSFRSLTKDQFNTIKTKFIALLAFLRDLARNGTFPIYTEDKEYCNFCDFKDICRKNHLSTAKRAGKSDYFKELRKFHYVPSRFKR
ncbi:MAG: exodeoxyribonuclease V subunit gamma [Elusimicrobiaceae bacterium]|nr:exodeoxyribonuclease V subunit gamma [Elusimicrobiaceae bacterium]